MRAASGLRLETLNICAGGGAGGWLCPSRTTGDRPGWRGLAAASRTPLGACALQIPTLEANFLHSECNSWARLARPPAALATMPHHSLRGTALRRPHATTGGDTASVPPSRRHFTILSDSSAGQRPQWVCHQCCGLGGRRPSGDAAPKPRSRHLEAQWRIVQAAGAATEVKCSSDPAFTGGGRARAPASACRLVGVGAAVAWQLVSAAGREQQ